MTLAQTITQLATTFRRQAARLVAVRTLWLAVALGLALVIGDAFLHFPDTLRLTLDFSYVAALIVAGIVSFRRLTRVASPTRMIARLIETHDPRLKNDLVSAVEFAERLDGNAGEIHASRELMQQHVALATQEAAGVNGPAALRPPALRIEAIGLAAVVVLVAALAVVKTDLFTTVLPRFGDPYGDHPPFSATRFRLDPAGATVHYGDNLRINAVTSGRRPNAVELVIWDTHRHELAALPMFDSGDGIFFQTVESLHEDCVFFARAAEGRSQRYPLTLIPWPRIDTVTVHYEYPAYTFLRPETRLLNEKVLKGYQQTKVTLTITSNKPLQGGTLTVGGQTIAMTPREATTVAGTFVIENPGTFTATISDRDGHASRDTLSGQIEVIPDQKPEIAIVNPSRESFATPDAKVPVNIEATDDLGISRVEIFRSLNGSEDSRKSVYVGNGHEKLVNVIETFDLADLGVHPGDEIEFYATAADTYPRGPQTAATSAYRVTIISTEEYRGSMQMQMRAEQLTQKYDEHFQQLQQLADEQEKLAKEIHELRQKQQLTAADKERLNDALAKQEELARQTDALAKQLAAEAQTPPIYDVEVDYKQALAELAKNLTDAQKAMTGAADDLRHSKLEDANAGQQMALDSLGRYANDYKQGIGQANRDIEHVSRLLEDVEQFKQLLGQQKDLERQMRFYKDKAPLDATDRARSKELGAQQAEVREALGKLKSDLEKHAGEVEKDYPKVAGDAQHIAREIDTRGIEQSMQAGADKLQQSDAPAGYPDVRSAYEQMQAMVGECDSTGQGASQECELRLKMQMQKRLGNTLQQLARGFQTGLPGAGQMGRLGQGATGESGAATPFDMFGSEQPSGVARRSSALGRRSHQAQLTPAELGARAGSVEDLDTTKRTEMDISGAGGERVMEEYRKLIEEYFKRSAEETP